ncbi:MAG: transposase [Minisyncoccia bacterium]|jgi:transposase
MGRPSKYTEEFRREAVELFLSGDRPRSKVAESLGIHDGSLSTWVKEHERNNTPGALSDDERAELKGLHKENAELKQDREILKRAAVYFAKETTR